MEMKQIVLFKLDSVAPYSIAFSACYELSCSYYFRSLISGLIGAGLKNFFQGQIELFLIPFFRMVCLADNIPQLVHLHHISHILIEPRFCCNRHGIPHVPCFLDRDLSITVRIYSVYISSCCLSGCSECCRLRSVRK